MLQLLWRQSSEAPISRRDLHRRLRTHPNLVGKDVLQLIRQGILREGAADPSGRGRPSIPLEIDPDSRHVIGLSLSPGAVELAKLNLRGQRLAEPVRSEIADSKALIARAREMLADSVERSTLGVGVSATGLYDEDDRSLLISSTFPGQAHVSLLPILKAAGNRRVLIRNDMYARAARWLLSPAGVTNEDVLLASLEDGQIGAVMLIDGRPNRGCLVGGNELGHMRFPTPTDVCFCGSQGCLERIFSSPQLYRLGGPGSLADALFNSDKLGAAADEIMQWLARALANVINFVRPHRVVLVGTFAADAGFTDRLRALTTPQLLAGLSDRVRIGAWTPAPAGPGETAAWLGLTEFFIPPLEARSPAPRVRRHLQASVE